MDVNLASTPLHAWHVAHGGRMVEFAGWSMPIQYTSIGEEHRATRNSVTLFDVSHMGRILLQGPGHREWLDQLVTRRITEIPQGRIRYSLVTRDDGGVLDDILVYRLDWAGIDTTLLVVNASNRTKIWQWLLDHAPGDRVALTDWTEASAMIAVQGPRALRLATDVLAGTLGDPLSLRPYSAICGGDAGDRWVLSRTGYTGEDGVELIVPSGQALALWEQFSDPGRPLHGTPAGLGARDTLRLEAAMPLYGHELDEHRNAACTGLDFAIQCDGRTFIGAEAIREARARGPLPQRVGLVLDGKRVGRQGATLVDQEKRPVGEITSGTFSPTLDRSIAMAYVESTAARVGTRLDVDVRGKWESAEVVGLPFYTRPAAN